MAKQSLVLHACALFCLLTPIAGAAQTAPRAPVTCSRCVDCSTDPQVPRVVRVKVYNQTHMQQADIDALIDLTNRIWLPYGVSIEQVESVDALAIVVSAVGRKPALVDGRAVLGETLFSQNHATPYIRLWLGAARALSEATPTNGAAFVMLPREERDAILLRMMGVALAHELAHYLLDTERHSLRGLLRAAISIRDFQQPDLARLELTRGQQRLMCRK